MEGRAPSDLVRQMRILIAEEVYLCEITRQITDYLGSERTITHGPWQAADCQQVLTRWFDCGLIDCTAVSWATKVRSDEVVHCEYDADWRARATENGQHLVLARDDAGALLSDPRTWRADGVGAGVMLCQSDLADGLSFDAWLGKLAGLPDHLIYEDLLRGGSGAEAQKTFTEPEEVTTARLWTHAVEQLAMHSLPLVCPINQDADLAVDWEQTESETTASESIEDVFCFIDRSKIGRGQPLPFGRHRLWCPGCDAERYLVVRCKPS